MDEIAKLRVNISCLIRLTKTELEDVIEDLKINQKTIDYYSKKDPEKYNLTIENLKKMSSIFIDIMVEKNNKLLGYYNELNKFKDIESNSSNVFVDSKFIEIDKLQTKLENSVTNLSNNVLKEKQLKAKFNNSDDVKISLSQTEYFMKNVLIDYNNLKQAKFECYNNHQNVLSKKYN